MLLFFFADGVTTYTLVLLVLNKPRTTYRFSLVVLSIFRTISFPHSFFFSHFCYSTPTPSSSRRMSTRTNLLVLALMALKSSSARSRVAPFLSESCTEFFKMPKCLALILGDTYILDRETSMGFEATIVRTGVRCLRPNFAVMYTRYRWRLLECCSNRMHGRTLPYKRYAVRQLCLMYVRIHICGHILSLFSRSVVS